MSDIMLNSQARREYIKTITGFLHFIFNKFRYSLALFSKFSASFPLGTCTLLGLHEYLALSEIYHLRGAAFPNNSILAASSAIMVKISPSQLYQAATVQI